MERPLLTTMKKCAPLTPALSPEERGKRNQSNEMPGRFVNDASGRTVLPLPAGEGRGEGERGITSGVASSPTVNYPDLFAHAFGTSAITADRMARALEQFLLTLTAHSSKFDQVLLGREKFTAEEQRGFELFHTEYDPRHGQFGADCFHCHGGPLFSDFAFHNNGLDAEGAAKDLGRFFVTTNRADRAKFKTPSLRNVAVTAPYMHDGRFGTLAEAVAHYATGVQRSATLDPNLAKHPDGGMPLTAEDQRALITFLGTLTDRGAGGTALSPADFSRMAKAGGGG